MEKCDILIVKDTFPPKNFSIWHSLIMILHRADTGVRPYGTCLFCPFTPFAQGGWTRRGRGDPGAIGFVGANLVFALNRRGGVLRPVRQ